MSALTSIAVCQNTTCQNKGSKAILQALLDLYEQKYKEQYPELKIIEGDCNGDCEQGPTILVNKSIVVRKATEDTICRLLENPDDVVGELSHVQEEDKETFERIVQGDLY
ncbi:MAG: (2Fe-2S) ferredoxin domain-containing protein [Candidatus Kerfeldbacteria bacterium]